jgi:hypothetical protein
MDREKKQHLIDQIKAAQEHLDTCATGDHEIGNLCNASAQLADVLLALVEEVSAAQGTAEMCSAVIGRML